MGATLRRDWGEIRFALMVSIIAGTVAAAGYLLTTSGGGWRSFFGWGLAIVFGFFSAVALIAAGGGKFARCPSCAEKLAAVEGEGGLVRCLCGALLVTRAGKIELLPADHVHQSCRFAIAVPEGGVSSFRLPESCCVCCQPATRREEMIVRDSRHVETFL